MAARNDSRRVLVKRTVPKPTEPPEPTSPPDRPIRPAATTPRRNRERLDAIKRWLVKVPRRPKAR